MSVQRTVRLLRKLQLSNSIWKVCRRLLWRWTNGHLHIDSHVFQEECPEPLRIFVRNAGEPRGTPRRSSGVCQSPLPALGWSLGKKDSHTILHFGLLQSLLLSLPVSRLSLYGLETRTLFPIKKSETRSYDQPCTNGRPTRKCAPGALPGVDGVQERVQQPRVAPTRATVARDCSFFF